MSTVIDTIVTQALQLSPRDRAAIAERLISSLDDEIEPDVEIAWQEEVQSRLAEIDNGEVVCIPWEQVLHRLRRDSLAANRGSS